MKEAPDIRVRGLSVRYGAHEVLRDVAFEVARGEFVAVVGRSGVGKSTLLYALAGFVPCGGEVSMPADVGVVFQDSYAVFPWLTVRGNIAFGLHGMGRARREEVIARLLRLTGLESHAHKYPAQLSGGQAQRVALARALAPEPRVLLMDEPFAALDTFTRDQMEDWLLEVWGADRKTVLFVTHNIEEAVFLSDRVLVLGPAGRLREFEVPIPRPRDEACKFSPRFVDLKRCLVEALRQA